jgi:hypothetical protein
MKSQMWNNQWTPLECCDGGDDNRNETTIPLPPKMGKEVWGWLMFPLKSIKDLWPIKHPNTWIKIGQKV